MRDLLVMSIVCWGALAALRRPWIGVLLWVWVSIMNPHRFTYGFAYSAPVAQIAALGLLLGLLFNSDQRESPFKGTPVTWTAVFIVWVTLSWLFGLSPAADYEQWKKVIKILLMVMVGLAVVRTKQHIFAFIWVTTLSMALLGAKGGFFTITSGGNFRVWGPPGSQIEDNNEFALACIMAVPLVRFLQLQVERGWRRHVLAVLMLLCVASALGSHSRGGLLALLAMGFVLWWRSHGKIVAGVVILVFGVGLIAFMPEHWSARMSSIDNYEEDLSALGRFSAWWTAFGVALRYPFGAGFDVARHDLFALYSPLYPTMGTVHAAHSIYFQVLGNHGFIGLFVFLMIWATTWKSAGWLRKQGQAHAEAKWAADLGSMVQVSLAGYLAGGAFLSLSYFDLPYNIMAMVVLVRAWVTTRSWEHEPKYVAGWRTIPGLASASVGRS